MTPENLRRIKDIAIILLETPISQKERNRRDEDGFISHPVFSSRFRYDFTTGEFYDLLENEETLQRDIQRYKKFFEKCESLDAIIMYINKPYRLMFLDMIKNLLSPSEMGRFLADLWVSTEAPNKNELVPLSVLIKWFKQADKETLMDEEELAYYNSLPDEFTVYRGIASQSNKKGISYTLSLEKAEWFAARSCAERGYILTGTAKKKNVLAYFNSREEQEVLIEPKTISDLHKL